MTKLSVDAAFAAASQRWTGCDWPVEFGPLKLRLMGLKAKQVLLIANATSGAESAQWLQAFRWLLQVEHDALTAEHAARQARDAADMGDWAAAVHAAEQACELEHRYPLKDPVWAELLMVVKSLAALGGSRNAHRGFVPPRA